MTSQDAGKDGHEDEEHEELAGLDYEPSVNQTGHHPMPASHHDDAGQASVRQNEEHWRRSHGSDQPVSHEAAHGKPCSASQAVPGNRRPRDARRPAPGRDSGDKS